LVGLVGLVGLVSVIAAGDVMDFRTQDTFNHCHLFNIVLNTFIDAGLSLLFSI